MEQNNCCKKGASNGIFYGLIPHIGCIAFIIFTILGVTTMSAIFKPLMMSRYFFYVLIVLSLLLASISGTIYLKRNNSLSKQGIKENKNYILTLFGTTILVNLLFFFLIFPALANISSSSTTNAVAEASNTELITLSVKIPCPGHASLIKNELYTIDGIENIDYNPLYVFEVYYDPEKTNEQEILSLEIFSNYKATKV